MTIHPARASRNVYAHQVVRIRSKRERTARLVNTIWRTRAAGIRQFGVDDELLDLRIERHESIGSCAAVGEPYAPTIVDGHCVRSCSLSGRRQPFLDLSRLRIEAADVCARSPRTRCRRQPATAMRRVRALRCAQVDQLEFEAFGFSVASSIGAEQLAARSSPIDGNAVGQRVRDRNLHDVDFRDQRELADRRSPGSLGREPDVPGCSARRACADRRTSAGHGNLLDRAAARIEAANVRRRDRPSTRSRGPLR